MRKLLIWVIMTVGGVLTLSGAYLWWTFQPPAPLRDDHGVHPAALDTLEAVIAQSRLYTRAQSDAATAAYLKHFEGVVYDRLSVAIARQVRGRTVKRGS